MTQSLHRGLQRSTDRWEPERPFDLDACAALPISCQTTFTHAPKVREVSAQLGWFKIRFADLPEPMWALLGR